MKAVNLTLSPVELAPVNGPGMLLAADELSDGGHERELEEVTDREQALARAGTIALVDTAGRRRRPPAAEPAPAPVAEGDGEANPGGES